MQGTCVSCPIYAALGKSMTGNTTVQFLEMEHHKNSNKCFDTHVNGIEREINRSLTDCFIVSWERSVCNAGTS